MLEVFLCHAPQDAGDAQKIAAHLQRWGDVQVLLEPCDSIPEAWDGGLSSDAILLLLSPDSVPKSAGLEAWAPLLAHLDGNAAPPLASVMLRDCAVPGRLKRKRHHTGVRLRDLERWVMSLHIPPPSAPEPHAAAQDRREELNALWAGLVDTAGSSMVDSRLARQFACEAGEHFREVLWIDCLGRPNPLLVGELAWRLGVCGSGTLAEVVERVETALAARRLLVVLDGLPGELPFALPETCRSSILATGQAAPLQVDPMAEMQAALIDALPRDWNVAVHLAQRACVTLKGQRRQVEAVYLYERVRERALALADRETANWCEDELSWLLNGDRISPVEIAGSQLSLDLA